MYQFIFFLSVLCFVAEDMFAASPEVHEEAEVFVVMNIGKGFALCEGSWDITSLQTASGEPLCQAIVDLAERYTFNEPFQSKVLDDAMKALVEVVERDTAINATIDDAENDDDKDLLKERTPLKAGVKRRLTSDNDDQRGSSNKKKAPVVDMAINAMLNNPENDEDKDLRKERTPLKAGVKRRLPSDDDDQRGSSNKKKATVVDVAINAMLSNPENDDDKDLSKERTPLKAGVERLTSQSGWFWRCMFHQNFYRGLIPGVVRLFVPVPSNHHVSDKRVPGRSEMRSPSYNGYLLFECAPVEIHVNSEKPFWWWKAQYWQSDVLD